VLSLPCFGISFFEDLLPFISEPLFPLRQGDDKLILHKSNKDPDIKVPLTENSLKNYTVFTSPGDELAGSWKLRKRKSVNLNDNDNIAWQTPKIANHLISTGIFFERMCSIFKNSFLTVSFSAFSSLFWYIVL
jgi:hypothetical protein